MKVFWFMRAEQGHKSAGDTQFIQLLRWLNVQVYRAKKNVNASNESPQLRVKLRAVAGTVTGAVAGTVTGAVTVKLTNAQTLTLTASRLNSITPPKRQRDGSHSLADQDQGAHGTMAQEHRYTQHT